MADEGIRGLVKHDSWVQGGGQGVRYQSFGEGSVAGCELSSQPIQAYQVTPKHDVAGSQKNKDSKIVKLQLGWALNSRQ